MVLKLSGRFLNLRILNIYKNTIELFLQQTNIVNIYNSSIKIIKVSFFLSIYTNDLRIYAAGEKEGNYQNSSQTIYF